MSPLQDVKMVMHIQVRSHEQSRAPGLSLPDPGQPSPAGKPAVPGSQHSAGIRQVQMQRLVTQNSSALSVWGEGAPQAHPGLSLLVFIGLVERCWRNGLFLVCYWCWWNSWESGGPRIQWMLYRHWETIYCLSSTGRRLLCSAKGRKCLPVAAIHQSLAPVQKVTENSSSSFNLFIFCVCAGRVCSVYWSKQDFISVLSVEETSGFHSRLSLILPFLLFYFCLFT